MNLVYALSIINFFWEVKSITWKKNEERDTENLVNITCTLLWPHFWRGPLVAYVYLILILINSQVLLLQMELPKSIGIKWVQGHEEKVLVSPLALGLKFTVQRGVNSQISNFRWIEVQLLLFHLHHIRGPRNWWVF